MSAKQMSVKQGLRLAMIGAVMVLGGCHAMVTIDPPDEGNPAPKDSPPKAYGSAKKSFTKATILTEFEKLNGEFKTDVPVQIDIEQRPATIDSKSADHSKWLFDFQTIYSPQGVMRTVKVHNSDPGVFWSDGWGYYWGLHPVGGTKRVQMIGLGTEYYAFSDGVCDRVVNLSSDASHNVTITGGGVGTVILKPSYWIKVCDTGGGAPPVVTGPVSLTSSDPQFKSDIEDLKKMVAEANKVLVKFGVAPPDWP